MTALLEIEGLDKRYGTAQVLSSLSLTLAAGEFIVLIGGSGSGKTTLLRLVAGLERADRGTIRLRGAVADGKGCWVPPERRRLGMVFQDFALWPHLTCLENVEAAIPRQKPARRAGALALLDRVGLADKANARPASLSGGQQQRVGVARALAGQPDLLLLDEPLSNLDMDIRERLRLEIRDLARESGAGLLLVSHDPTDAWRLADRVAVLEGGILTQAAAPRTLYDQPQTARIARFIGAEGGFRARLIRRGGQLGVALDGSFHPATPFGVAEGEEGQVFIRPAGLRAGPKEVPGGVKADLLHCAFEGGAYRAYWRLPGTESPICSIESAPPAAETRLAIAPSHILIYPIQGEMTDA